MPPAKPQPKRCAVYTRKSSEEGLDQDFNSLQAQREACESFIHSQKAEGWRLMETAYDDGGFSGGSMERPGLRALLDDIRHKRIDIVVVYKIDRLTRSLADFAKMVEVFDQHGVSFVAVTQQFNTTSSMGRLTLNILLSFAQFEREVTAERIRDKIAASKQKGMWMGGNVPLGYDAKDRKLVINKAEAETVRHIFARYLELGSVRDLRQELERTGIKSKMRQSANGETTGGNVLSRGALYNVLSNPVYIGEIRHGRLRHPGLHLPIIERNVWDRVQAYLANNAVARSDRPLVVASSPLVGKLFNALGEGLTPSHSVKAGRRYRYYVSRSLISGTADSNRHGWRLPAPDLERAVSEAVGQTLSDRQGIAAALGDAGLSISDLPNCWAEAANEPTPIDLVQRVEVAEDALTLTLSLSAIVPAGRTISNPDALIIIRTIPMRIRRRGVEMRLIVTDSSKPSRVDPALLKAITRGRTWWNDLATGTQPTIAAIARRDGCSEGYVRQLLPLAFLAPSIVEAIVTGQHPVDLTVETLVKRIDLPLSWEQQRAMLGCG